MIGWRGQKRGRAVVGDGPFELYSSDEGQHVSSSSSCCCFWAKLLRVLVLTGGWNNLRVVLSALAQTGGLSLAGGGRHLDLVLVLVQLLFLLLAELLAELLLIQILILQRLVLLKL